MNGPAPRAQAEAAPVAAERRVRLTLEYDGAAFAGWQLQPVARTVQGELEGALARIFAAASRTRTAGAGRTDAGVHATGQVVSVVVPERWHAAELARALNAVLPFDMRVAAAEDAAPDFHARFSAVGRGYIYRVGTTAAARSPFLRRWCWPLERPLPGAALDAAAAAFRGAHDFRAFARTGQPERGTECTVHRAEWRVWGAHGVSFAVVANRFLHHMVRYMVGTMVEIALGGRDPGDIVRLLEQPEPPPDAPGARLQMSRPAPPGGLFLSRVYYPGDSLHEDLTDEILS